MAVNQKRVSRDLIKERIEWFKAVDEEVLHTEIGTSERRREVLRIYSMMSPDAANGPILERWLTEANNKGSTYWEIRTLLHWFSARFTPRTYLEVGVRRGWSMAQVVAAHPDVDVFGIDLWIRNYAGATNPGPSLVRSELAKLGHRGRLRLVSGNSHKVLPRALKPHDPTMIQRFMGWPGRAEEWPAAFDLILVDGDHSVGGARRDLLDVMPHCALGGMVVFDDLAYEGDERYFRQAKSTESLLTVWESVQPMFPGFRFFTNLRDEPGTGIAVRLR